MAVSRKMRDSIEHSSWIRRMFEAGSTMRARHGADKVSDFSLGNPDVDPPPEFQRALQEVVSASLPRKHLPLDHPAVVAMANVIRATAEELLAEGDGGDV